MVAQFPAESSNSSTVNSSLIPKLDVSVNIIDEGSLEHNPLNYNAPIVRYFRVVELRINAKNIQIALIKSAVKRIFTYATHSVINDMNIVTGFNISPELSPFSRPTNNPRVKITIDVDRTKRDKTVDLELIILNIKADCITETFNRLSLYLEEAITTDLNPSV